mgnify:CR=1 FL=1|tara:strand:+ start:964 stop:1494 length:531 start_codon:yes stop_codon:yes gene_type:complete
MKYTLLAQRYIKAYANCFDTVEEKCKNLEMLYEVVKKISADQDTFSLLQDPTVVLSKKMKVLNLYLPKGNLLLANFLSLLVSKARIFLLEDMVYDVESMIYDLKGAISAVAYSSTSLRSADQAAIVAYLKEYFKKDVDLKTVVDESILAGVRVESNNIVFDATLDNSLKNLKLAFQ